MDTEKLGMGKPLQHIVFPMPPSSARFQTVCAFFIDATFGAV
jgi:hypothetical protein